MPQWLLLLSVVACGVSAFTVIADGAEQPEVYPSFVLPEGILRVEFDFPLDRLMPEDELEAEWLDAAQRQDELAIGEWEHWAMQWFANNRFDMVIETYRQAADSAPADLSANLLWVAALSHEALEEWASALAVWSALHRRQPSDPLPVVRMAVSLLHTGHGGEALAILKRGALHFPDQPVLQHLLAACHWMKGDPRDAWRALARASVSGTVSRETLIFLAWVTLQDGTPEEAVGWLRQAFTRSPAVASPALQKQLDYFSAIHEHPAYIQLMAELELPLAEADEVAGAKTTGEARVAVVPAEPAALPESLRISIRLQDAASPDAGEDLGAPWNPEELTGGVNLRVGEVEPRPAYILLHDMPREDEEGQEAGWWAVQDSNL